MLNTIRSRGAFSKPISLSGRRERLHVMPTSTGYDLASGPSYKWDGRRRGNMPFIVLQHTMSGQGRLRYGHHTYRITPGETMLVIIPHDHCYWLEESERWEFFWIAMTGQEALRLSRAIVASSGPVFTLGDETIERLATCCLDLAEHSDKPGIASAGAYTAIMALYDDLIGAQERPRTITAHVVAYIRQHLDADLDVQKLADISGLSRAHFSRVFSRQEGISPAEFVMIERTQLAVRLLTSGKLGIKMIAKTCGFEDPNYFSKAFRRIYGVSPSEFRSTGMYGGQATPTQSP